METVLRNARIVDGTGSPAVQGDVGIDGGRIVAIGDLRKEPATNTVDLSGLVLAPGFIDVHTHYDAQILQDPDVTPSSWNGVTSVVMGNCGFGVAPLRPADRELVRDMLCSVEQMPTETVNLADSEFASIGAYVDSIRHLRPRINAGVLVGHSSLRIFVMGPEASHRAATAAEVSAMQAVLAAGMGAGALGFATSRAPAHQGPPGLPVPSRLADLDELEALGEVLGDGGKGVIQIDPGPDYFLEEMAALSQRIGRPISWSALLGCMKDFGSSRAAPGYAMELLDRADALGGEVWPQVSCRPLVVSFTMVEPFVLRRLPAFQDLLGREPAERRSAYGDPAWRSWAEHDLDEQWSDRWDRVSVQESGLPADRWQGRSLQELAAIAGKPPSRTMLDLVVEDGFRTRYRVSLFNDDLDEVGTLLGDPRTVLGLSDAGAHSDQFCDAAFPAHLLGTWVRERGVLSLEQAVWRLSGQPAHVFRLQGRGLVHEGYAADLVAFDPETVRELPVERVNDLAGGHERLVARSSGIEGVWVNGTRIADAGKAIDSARSGQMLVPEV